jgi:hypothetical protein
MTKNFSVVYKPVSINEKYLAGSDGNIYSTHIGLKKLKPGISKSRGSRLGYKSVVLCNDKYRITKRVHKLIAEAFLGESDLTVNHKNGNTLDNRIENLEYCTQSENNIHAIRNGLRPKLDGVKNGNAKLTEEIVNEVRNSYPKKSYRILSKEYNIPITTLGHIIKRRTWQHI